MRKPYLVQRIEERKCLPGEKGVDKVFSFDYMGSAEFEFGALPRALKILREHGKKYSIHRLKYNGATAWAVATEENVERAREFFFDQLEGQTWRLKERSRLLEALTEDDYYVIGWWAIDIVPGWLIFKKKYQAQNWLKEMK